MMLDTTNLLIAIIAVIAGGFVSYYYKWWAAPIYTFAIYTGLHYLHELLFYGQLAPSRSIMNDFLFLIVFSFLLGVGLTQLRKSTINRLILLSIVTLVPLTMTVYVMKSTTFEEAISQMLDKNETIIAIDVNWRSLETDKFIDRKVTIEDKETIKRLIDESTEMSLFSHNRTSGMEFYLTIYTDQSRHNLHRITFEGRNIMIGDEFYRLLDENRLKEAILNENFDWEILD
ncbi:hypothetical protein LGQ02_03890 [Bacillus shivajii]|uniref:hypothetical protein n=1 Tax=Bacillus shivajii TaxID=1983719 RepID=UPI001CFA5AEF|nr:hypothetical protein [Bacillus shivajii]UCZ53935.1 hypothetical protein LGQ02_03890 [Bacillus shivajii]